MLTEHHPHSKVRSSFEAKETRNEKHRMLKLEEAWQSHRRRKTGAWAGGVTCPESPTGSKFQRQDLNPSRLALSLLQGSYWMWRLHVRVTTERRSDGHFCCPRSLIVSHKIAIWKKKSQAG